MRKQQKRLIKTAALSGGVLMAAVLIKTTVSKIRLRKKQSNQIIESIKMSTPTNQHVTDALITLFQSTKQSNVLDKTRQDLMRYGFQVDTTNQLQSRTNAVVEWIASIPEITKALNQFITLSQSDLSSIDYRMLLNPSNPSDDLTLTAEFLINCFTERPYGGHPIDTRVLKNKATI